MSQHERVGHKGPPELCLACRADRLDRLKEIHDFLQRDANRAEAIEIDIAWQEAKQEMARSFERAYEWAAPPPRYTVPDLPLVPADYPGEKEWQAWLADDHLYSKRTLVAKHPTTTRAVFIDGFKAAAESQLEALRPYIQHKLTCPTYDKDRFGVPFTCDCGLMSLVELEGAEVDPDVADTAWAIIAHHHKHRTAG